MTKRSAAPDHDHLCCWPDCFQPATEDRPLCEVHYRDVGMAWMTEHIDLVREAVTGNLDAVYLDHVTRRIAQRKAADDAGPDVRPQRDGTEGVVYYIDLGDCIKIGTTTNLRARLTALRVDAHRVLATEPGGYVVERQRHREFTDERIGQREDFAKSDRLLAHIEGLRK